MSTTDLENSTVDDTQHQPDEESAVFANLRKDRDAAKADAVASKRELTLYRAGLGELSEKQMKALSAAHEGDWEPELLKATAAELGFVQQPGEAEGKAQIPAAELEAHQRVANAAGGEQASPEQDLTAKIMSANSPQEVMELLRNSGRYDSGE